MARAALESIRTQANEIVGDIVGAYSTRVAQGEVGSGGSSRASGAPPLNGECPTGLLYGRVQSGKTAAMIVTTALAIDNGFRIIVVLTSNNLELVKQTAKRFEVLNGPIPFSSLDAGGGDYAWDRDRANVQRWMGTRGVVFVCAKEDEHLRALIRFLQSSGAFEYPALIMDDEADQATPDTTMARRTRGNPVPNASATFRLVVGNDAQDEQGLSLRETLRHNVFLQVTATPYGLLLQNLDNPLRPEFTYLLHPGTGYMGGETFFADAADPPSPPLCFVDETESQILRGNTDRVPDGLARSVAFFILSASAHSRLRGGAPRDGYKHLCHTSASRAEHERLAAMVRRYTHELADQLDRDFGTAANRPDIRWAYDELRRTVPEAPPLEELLQDVARHLPNRRVLVVNAQGDRLDFGPQYAFVVGGNILSRGLTIDDLLVTYYFRQPRVTQMDTMHQHARMYGYRRPLLPFTRVFLPPSLARRFQAIHETEQGLRDLLDEEGTGRALPVQTAGDLRPTRTNILDVGTIAAYRPGQQVYPVEPVHDPAALGNSVTEIDREVARLFGGRERPNEFLSISIDEAKRLIGLVRLQDGGEWDSEAMALVLTTLSERYDNEARLYVRRMERTDTRLSSAAISGKEQADARAQGRPVLFLFKDGEPRGRGAPPNPWLAPFWYPSIVFPPDMPVMVFNRST